MKKNALCKYTDYCTCFSYKNPNSEIEICFWDEIKDEPIKTMIVESKEAAKETMDQWIKNAPAECICQHIVPDTDI